MAETRRLIRLGSASLVVSLPPSWVKRMGLRPGSLVRVEEEGDKVVISAVDDRGSLPVVLDVDRIDNLVLGKLPSCFYVLGLDNVMLVSGKGMSSRDIYRLKTSALRLSGVEVMETEKGVVVRTLLDASRIDPSLALRQISITISKIAETLIQALREESIDPLVLRLSGQELFRLQHIVIKNLVSSSAERNSKARNTVLLIAASLLGLLGDYMASMALDFLEKRAMGGFRIEDLAELVDGLGRLVVKVVSALISPSVKRARSNMLELSELREKAETLRKTDAPGIAGSIVRIEDCLRILEIVNNMAICSVLLGDSPWIVKEGVEG